MLKSGCNEGQFDAKSLTFVQGKRVQCSEVSKSAWDGLRSLVLPAMFLFGYRSQNSGVQLLPLCHSKQHRLHTAVMVKRGGNMCMNHQELPMDLLALDLFGLELTCASAR
jgi:hypothetical protein